MTELNKEPSQKTFLLTKSEKEIELINKNRDALTKRDECILRKSVDVESSFTSKGGNEIRSSIETNLLETSKLRKEKARKFISVPQPQYY